jgi:beta-phosphoglucomutase-like phosphatase (HAD superfamily)
MSAPGENMPATTLLLLDMDNVLVNARGYKEAVRQTADYFARALGQPPFELTDDEIALMEAAGITSEFEMMPLWIGSVLAEAIAQRPDLARGGVDAVLDAVRTADLDLSRPATESLVGAVRDALEDGARPAEVILNHLCASSVEAAHPLMAELLTEHFTPASPTTRVFQHYVLGSERYEQTYGLPARFEAESTLLAHDRPLLNGEMAGRVLAGVAAGAFGAAIYTARPSLPPVDAPDADPTGYPPEAELAAGLVGLVGLPLIAVGRATWLARKVGRTIDEFIKPSPVQALAAIGAALTGAEAASLRAAYALAEGGELIPPLDGLIEQGAHVVVFEDSQSGIHAVRNAAALLGGAGASVTFEAVGIAPEGVKRDALKAVAGCIAPDINTALAGFL